MKKYMQLVKEQDELSRKYAALYAEKSELQYELNVLKEKTDDLQKQDAQIRLLHQNVRQLKHDMKNHFMVLASCISSEDYDSAKAYISEILDKLNAMHSYVETGNSLMNHILNEKFEAARKQGILVKAEIENLAFAKMRGIDFSALLSNMLDNAIEACSQEASKEIHVVISRKRGYEAICVKNKIADSVLRQNPGLKSSKEGKEMHGIGIPGMKDIVETYDGIYDIYEADGFFCVCVFIPQ